MKTLQDGLQTLFIEVKDKADNKSIKKINVNK